VLWWLLMVNSFHDASHYALSRNLWITAFWQYLFPFFTSPTTWDHQHIIAHHVYTNIHKLVWRVFLLLFSSLFFSI
jgi:delta11-fatty-acid desaturase